MVLHLEGRTLYVLVNGFREHTYHFCSTLYEGIMLAFTREVFAVTHRGIMLALMQVMLMQGLWSRGATAPKVHFGGIAPPLQYG